MQIPTLWEYNKMSMLNLVASIVKTGVHGRILSSASGRPLPASIMVKGINYTAKAGSVFSDYHRLLAPHGRYEVMASMPGFKSKITRIWLEEEAMTLDFVLDPETTAKRNDLLQSECDFICNSRCRLGFPGFLGLTYLEIFLTLILILVFLFFLLKRRAVFRLPRHRQLGPKRLIVV